MSDAAHCRICKKLLTEKDHNHGPVVLVRKGRIDVRVHLWHHGVYEEARNLAKHISNALGEDIHLIAG